MSEKDLEQFNADVQENEAATAAPVDNASPEAIGEAIKEINGEADASAAPEKADDELQVGVIKPIATGKPESKRALKKAEKKKAKELKNIYHVSNWQIIKNYRNYNQQERKHYKYIFRRRITEKVWPVFRFLILFGLGFVILYTSVQTVLQRTAQGPRRCRLSRRLWTFHDIYPCYGAEC